MIICNECGLQNDDSDAFCGNCGAFLEWEGQAVEPDPEPQPVVEPVQEQPDRPGLIERVVDRFQGDDDPAAGPPPEAGTSQATGSSEPAAPAPEDPATSGQHQPAPPRAEPPSGQQQPAPPHAEPPPGQQPPPVERQPAPPPTDAPPTGAPPTGAPPTDPPPTGAEQQAPPSDPGDPAVVAAQRAEREAEEAEAAQRAAEQRVREHAEVAETAHRKVTEAEAEQQRLERLVQEEGAAGDPERSEGERVAAEARAEAEAESARRAAEEAAAAERAREQAEAEARKEAQAAERARRAASLVARPKPPPQTPSGPGPAPPSKPPRKRRAAPSTPPAPSDTDGTERLGAVAPQARHPGRAQPRPTPKQRTEQKRRLRPGDLVCGQCGEGNAPERRFCRRCGAPTVDAAPAEKPPWWRRLRRQPKTYEAGERPQRSTGSAKDKARGGAQKARSAKRAALKVMRIVALLAVVIGALAVTVGPWREPVVDWGMDRYDSVRQMVAPRFESLTALSAEASSELDGHPAGHAVDLANNTWWAAGPSEDNGVGERLFIDFEPAADIGAIGVTPGAADTEEYVAQPRPRRLHLVFDTGETRTLEIEDDHDFQSFRIDPVEGASRVEVQVDAVWLGQDGSSVSITEIEFQTRN